MSEIKILWEERFHQIKEIDSAWRQKAQKRLDEQTRPRGSLGRLEEVLVRFAAIQKKEKLSIAQKRILIFAADHGVVEEGISLYPREVTKAMVLNFINGGATINALARHAQAGVRVYDVGVAADFEPNLEKLQHHKIRQGTRNMRKECAMPPEELYQALEIGWNAVQQAKKDGVELLGLGEMGIGNTTAASAVIAALTGFPVASVTGKGTGLNDEILAHKVAVISEVLDTHTICHLKQPQHQVPGPLKVLSCVGGYELAAMTAAIAAAAHFEIPVLIDGWIVSASALVAIKMNPNILDYLFFAHRSEEPGHQLLLEELDVHPILSLSMRLGEASGAALAMNLLEAAVRIYNEVATFSEAGVPDRES